MEHHTIWGKLDLTNDVPNLYKELKIQAEDLADKTNGILYAEVNPVDAYDETTMDLGIVYNFYINAPYLGNYRAMLFTVVESGSKIYIIDRVNRGEKSNAANVEDLISKIEQIISTNEVSKLISNLYTSSLEIKGKRN